MSRKFFVAIAFAIAVSGLSAAADLSKLPNPLANIRVGQWTVYESMGDKHKQTVSKIEGEGDDRMITVAIEVSSEGEVTSTQEKVLDYKALKAAQDNLPTDDPDTTITDGKHSVGGKEIDVKIIDVLKDGTTTRIIISEAVPISGIVKMEIVGMGTMMELEDFGG